MLRKQIRERREYIYRKHKEEAESKIRDRKDRLKRALDENKPIPTELRVSHKCPSKFTSLYLDEFRKIITDSSVF